MKTTITKYVLTSGLLLGLAAIPLGAQQTATPASPDQNPQMQGQQQPGQPGMQSTTPGAQPETTPQQQSVSASQAVTQIQQSFQKDPTLAQSGVTVQVGTNNNIVLSGTVQSQADKDRAEQVARASASGVSVDNQIQVNTSGTTPESTMPQSTAPQSSTTPPPTSTNPQ